MSGPKTVTANWQEQHLLTTSENPVAGGDVSPAPPGEWYDDGTNAQVNATVESGYEWAGWTGALSGTTKPQQVLMNDPKSVTANFGKQVQITIETYPVGREFTVDGTDYTTTQVFTWVENSQHTLSVSSPQSGSTGIEYVYSSWSNGGSQSQTYTIPGSNQTVTANFTMRYYLTVTSTYGDPQGADWYDAGTSAGFSVTSPTNELNGTRYVFDEWSGAHSGTSPSGSVTMNAPKEVIAGWQPQHYLTIASDHGDPQGAGWYDSGENVNFSVTTPTDASGGTRYRFANWDDDYSGTNPSGTINMNDAKLVTAIWQTQYYLTTAENPAAGGGISPAPPGEWYDSGTNAQVDATVESGYEWAGWTGALSGTTKPQQVLMNAAKSVTANFTKQVQITIKTNPVGREFTVDGDDYTTTQEFTWLENSQHTISVSSPQSGSTGVEYIYSSWSDGGNQSHTYTVPGSNQTVTANFTTRYYLTVTSPRGNPQGADWYNAGTTANFSVTSPADENNGKRYVFDEWSGDSNASTASASITMNSPKEVVAEWITQYYLTVTSTRDNPQGEGWYNDGTTVDFSVTSPADEQNGTRYVLDTWSGDSNADTSSANIVMNSAKEVVAEWIKQYFLRTIENPDYGGDVDPAPPGDWYDSDTEATVTATPAGNYEWLGWSGNLSGKTNPAQITMNGPKSVTANFGGEEVTTPDTPSGPATGYTGQSLSFETEGAASTFGHAVEYKFDWGDGSESDWGSATETHAYSSKGNYTIKARARCATDTEVISSWSNGLTVNIYSFTLTTSVSPEGAGSIDRNPNKTGYDFNEVVTLTANGSSGSKMFDHWDGSLTGNQNPKDLTMNSNKSVRAYFITETVSTPENPVGPTQAYAGQSIDFEVDGAQSSFGHSVEYQLDFGDGNESNWQVSPINYTYSQSGIFEVLARARCADHNEIMSGWSGAFEITITGLTLTVNVNPESAGSVTIIPDKSIYDYLDKVAIRAIPNDGSSVFSHWDGVGGDSTDNPRDVYMRRNREITANFIQETVSTPNILAGPLEGSTDDVLTFQTGGAVSSFDHAVEYQFDWGDSTLSEWGDVSQSYSYLTFGTMQVRARARCVDHNQIISEWSQAYNVVISDITLTIHIEPQGKGTVLRNPDKNRYAEAEVVELTAEAEQFYLFDHWSGDLTGNSNPASIIMNGNKEITAHFVQTAEAVSRPTFITGPDSGIMGQTLQFSTAGSSSNLGNAVEYQFDWGDDSFSEWGEGTRSHNYFVSGELDVKSRARSMENISVISPWSDIKNVTISGRKLTIIIDPVGAGSVVVTPNQVEFIDSSVVQLKAEPNSGYGFIRWSGDVVGSSNPVTLLMSEDKNVTAHFEEVDETVSPPNTPVGLSNGIIGQNINFTADGSISSLGLEVEYQFDWGDGSLSTWNAGTGSHTFFESDTFYIKARARSKVNPGVLSGWSASHSLSLVGLNLTIKIEPKGNGLIAHNPNKAEYAYLDTVEIWPVGIREYSFNHWSGDLVGVNFPGKVIMNSDKSVTAHFVKIAEAVSSPTPPHGPVKGYRNQELIFKANGAVSNLGSIVEYQFDWGDGNTSSWGDSMRSYKFHTSGEFLIRCRARSKVSVNAVSNWSDTLGTAINGCKLVITLEPENSGDVFKNPNQVDYDYGTKVELTAVNNPTFNFIYWNNDTSDTTKVKEIIMNGDKELTAWLESALRVSDLFEVIPSEFALNQNYPNPFNPETKIEYQLAKECKVQIVVYNIKGQQVINLVNENQAPGNYSIVWNALDQHGTKVPSGIYLYHIKTEFFTSVRKMLLLK